MSVQSARISDSPIVTGQGWRIGVFDSGVGGLSVLRAIREQIPQADLVYVADSANAPYGERSDSFISERSHVISGFLIQQKVDAIVVACNTATAVAVHSLRQSQPGVPIVGVEPGIKPGITHSKNKVVGVLATPGTLASAKFKALVQSCGPDANLVLQACPGLAKEIEAGALDRPKLRALIEEFCQPLIQAEADTVVLGCTHYPFAADLFQQTLGPQVTLLDTAHAVARRTAALLSQNHPQTGHATSGAIELWTTGSPEHLKAIANEWLGWQLSAHVLSA